MKLDPVTFTSRFGVRAAQVAKGGPIKKPAEDTAPPTDSFLGRVSQAITNVLSPRHIPAQEKLATHVALNTLGAPTALALAQEVGVEMRPSGDPWGEKFLAKKADSVDQRPEPNQKMTQVWQKIVEVTGTEENQPVLLEDKASGPGRFVGRSMFADGETFQELPFETALFYTAHELGHLENSDASRKSGMSALAGGLSPMNQGILREARKEKDWEMEYQADDRAAEIAAKAGCEPGPILRDLMLEPSGTQHPPGLERAKRVRDVMASHGKSVSDEQWQGWVDSTATLRAEKQQQIDSDLEWKMAWEHIV